jgi:hypothetical protein
MLDLPGSVPTFLRATLPLEFARATVRMMMTSAPALALGTRPQRCIFHRFVHVRHA